MDYITYEVALVPLITGLVELAKRFGLSTKYSPILALSLGVFFGIFYTNPNDIKGGIIIGLMLGLSASGLYSGTKNTTQKIQEK